MSHESRAKQLLNLHGLSEEARKKRFQHTMTTRKDVMGIIDLYNQHKIIPLAARFDEMEKVVAYMALPLWRRLWLRLKRLGDGVLAWLERRGIRVYTVDNCGHEIRGHFTHCRRRER